MMMSVETRDPISGKYVLFRSPDEHALACEAHPYERIPRRIFLDTNVVNALVKFASPIFEGAPLDEPVDDLLAEDIESLMHIVAVGGRGQWTFISSSTMLQELSQTRAAATREALLNYGVELMEALTEDDHAFREDFSRRLLNSGLLNAMPDAPDRRLYAEAIAMGCDAFCTRDRATIVSRRDLLPKTVTRIITPREWWEAIKPWGGLFA
jgi:hypothetical protein